MYLVRKRAVCKEIREYAARHVGLLDAFKTHIFLRKAKSSAEKQAQVISGDSNRYEYSLIRNSMPALVPEVVYLRNAQSSSERPCGHDSRDGRPGTKYNGRRGSPRRSLDESEECDQESTPEVMLESDRSVPEELCRRLRGRSSGDTCKEEARRNHHLPAISLPGIKGIA